MTRISLTSAEFLGFSFRDDPLEFEMRYMPDLEILCRSKTPRGRGDSRWFPPVLRILWEKQQSEGTHGLWLREADLEPRPPAAPSEIIPALKKLRLTDPNRVFDIRAHNAPADTDIVMLRKDIGRFLEDHCEVDDIPEQGLVCRFTPLSGEYNMRTDQHENDKGTQPVSEAQAKAIKEYFDEGDAPHMRMARRRIYFEADGKPVPSESPERPDAVAAICSFFVKWGLVANGGHLPLHIFDGPSGDMAARMLLLCKEDIRALRRAGAHRYASWHAWLVREIDRRNYLGSWPKDQLQELRSTVNEFLPDRKHST